MSETGTINASSSSPSATASSTTLRNPDLGGRTFPDRDRPPSIKHSTVSPATRSCVTYASNTAWYRRSPANDLRMKNAPPQRRMGPTNRMFRLIPATTCGMGSARAKHRYVNNR